MSSNDNTATVAATTRQEFFQKKMAEIREAAAILRQQQQSVVNQAPFATGSESNATKPNTNKSRTPAWLTQTLQSVPKLATSIPRMAPMLKMFTGVDIPQIPTDPSTIQRICDNMESAITMVMQWAGNLVLFAWFGVSLLIHLALDISYAVPLLLILHSAIMIATLFDTLLKRFHQKFASIVAFGYHYTQWGWLQRFQTRIADYQSLSQLFGVRFLHHLVVSPLQNDCQVSDIVPFVLSITSINFLLLRTALLVVTASGTTATAYNLFWSLQYVALILLDLKPKLAFCYAGSAQVIAWILYSCCESLTVLQLFWLLVVLTAINIGRNHTHFESTRGTLETMCIYFNYLFPCMALASCGTTMWSWEFSQTVGAIMTLHCVMGLTWALTVSLATKARYVVIPNVKDWKQRAKFIALFALIPFTLQYPVLATLHGIVAFWILPDIILSSANPKEPITIRIPEPPKAEQQAEAEAKEEQPKAELPEAKEEQSEATSSTEQTLRKRI